MELYNDIQIFHSVNGYNIQETMDELEKINVPFKDLLFKTYGTLANWITKFKAFEYQVANSIEYMCLIEDDILLESGFKEYVISLLPLFHKRQDIDMIRLNEWGEIYITSLKGAENIIKKLRNQGIIANIDNQLRVDCGAEYYTVEHKFHKVMNGTNMGDCLKTAKFDNISPFPLLSDNK
jgi:hypothetical protein